MSNASSDAVSADKPKYPWGIASALIVLLATLVFPNILAEILVAFIPGILSWDHHQSTAWMDAPAADFLYVAVASILTLGLLIWFIRHRKASFRKAVALGRLKLRDLWYALGGTAAYFVLFVAILMIVNLVVPVNTDQEQAIGFAKDAAGLSLVMAFVSLVIIPPIVEEIVFRGFFFGTLRRSRRLSLAGATIITSLIFSALHLFGSVDGKLLWIAMIDTFALSVVLCFVREKTGSIVSSIAIHALKNGFVFLNLFILSAK